MRQNNQIRKYYTNLEIVHAPPQGDLYPREGRLQRSFHASHRQYSHTAVRVGWAILEI